MMPRKLQTEFNFRKAVLNLKSLVSKNSTYHKIPESCLAQMHSIALHKRNLWTDLNCKKNSYFYTMTTLQVDILNPKAGKLLEDLAELKLISIINLSDDGFLKLVNKFRAKAKSNPPSLEDITKEVEIVRSKRYARSKR